MTAWMENPETHDAPVKVLAEADFEYAVGDINSDEMGSGARANSDKPRWELMPIEQIASIMMREDHLITVVERYRSDKVADTEMMVQLGRFQKGKDAMGLMFNSVAYNWYKQGGPETMGLLTSLENVIRVWAYGLKKYAAFNWAKGMPWDVPFGCACRHVKQHFEGEPPLDAESGELHSAHVVCNTMMLAHYEKYWNERSPTVDARPYQFFGGGPKGSEKNP